MPSVPPFSAFLPPPGFFVSDYRGQGTKIVTLEYRCQERGRFTIYSFPAVEDHPAEFFLKDTNEAGIPVPIGFFRAFLDQPVFPTKEDQECFGSLRAVECQVPPPDYATRPAM